MKKKTRPRSYPMPAALVLRSLFRQKKWQQRVDLHQLFLRWDRVVGKDISAHAQPEVIRGTVLWLQVSDSVWMQQLQLQKQLLLERLNHSLAAGRLTDIRFHLHTAIHVPQQPVRRQEKAIANKIPPMPDHLRELIDNLDDEEMRQAVRAAWQRQAAK